MLLETGSQKESETFSEHLAGRHHPGGLGSTVVAVASVAVQICSTCQDLSTPCGFQVVCAHGGGVGLLPVTSKMRPFLRPLTPAVLKAKIPPGREASW